MGPATDVESVVNRDDYREGSRNDPQGLLLTTNGYWKKVETDLFTIGLRVGRECIRLARDLYSRSQRRYARDLGRRVGGTRPLE